MKHSILLASLLTCLNAQAQSVIKIDTSLPDLVIDNSLPDTKLDTLWAGRVLHAPLTDPYLQPSDKPSEIARGVHASTIVGSPTYSSTGMNCHISNDAVVFTVSGVTNRVLLTWAFRFTPDFDTDDNKNTRIFTTTGANTLIEKRNNSGSNALRIVLGNNTTIADIPEATYGPNWNVNQENTLVITGDDAANLTNVWLNNVQILINDSTAWANTNDVSIILCVSAGLGYAGELRDFRFYERILTATEITSFHNGDHP